MRKLLSLILPFFASQNARKEIEPIEYNCGIGEDFTWFNSLGFRIMIAFMILVGIIAIWLLIQSENNILLKAIW